MKKVLVVVMVMAFSVGTASVSMARSVRCTITAVDGNAVTMDCKKASKLKVDDKVRVKVKKARAIEGC